MKKTTSKKNLTNQFHGGRDNALGSTYEVNFFIQKIVEMIVINQIGGDGFVKIKRGKRSAHVDDVYTQTGQNKKSYFQCKRFLPDDRKELYQDFVSEYLNDSLCELWLVTQGSAKELRELTLLAQRESFVEFKKQLDEDNRYKKEKIVFESLQSCFPKDTSNIETQAFEFLSKFNVLFYDEIWSREQIVDKLCSIFEKDSSERIRDRLFAKAASVDWVDKEVTWDEVKAEIESLNPQPNYSPKTETSDKSINPSTDKPNTLSLLADSSTPFMGKLDYILKLIEGGLDETEVRKALCLIKEDHTLTWHFLKNLKNPSWYPIVKDNVIKSVIEDTSDSATKYQLLSFFEKCAVDHSDDIVPLLLQLERNTQSYHILANLIRTVGLLKPKSKVAIAALWQIFDELVEHQHPWVRREIPKALLSFIDLDEDKVFSLFRKLFDYSPPPQDVTQGSPTLALTFQGRDNENWVFEEAIQSFSELLSNPKYAEKAHALGIEVEKNALSEDGKLHDTEEGITLDYSSIWLSDKSFDSERLEYNHDRKERVILEIEKSLNNLVIGNQELVTSLLDKLLTEKYEVFHLTAIKVLTRHLDKYTKLGRFLVFDPKLWNVYNIRNYFLQTLATTYFKTAIDDEINNFVEIVDQQKLKDDKKTLYLKQSMLVSIPDDNRTQVVTEKLESISESLKVKPKIAKPFAVTTWSGIRPDIKVEELKTKNENELLQIMIDSTNGKRAASYDIAPVFAQLIDQKPAVLPGLLKNMKGKNIAADFAGEMVDSYCKKLPEEITKIADLIPLLNVMMRGQG